jgi:hypothetical protein
MKNYLILFFSVISFYSFSQQTITTGQVYNAGERIYAPRLGFNAIIPEGWMGMLPQNSSIFLLTSANGLDGQIYILGDTTDFEVMKRGWTIGLELEEGRVLKSDGNIKEENGSLSSNVILTGGQNKAYTGFIEAKCGEFGRCVSAMLICEINNLDEMKKSVSEFLGEVVFLEPVMIHEYASFDWRQFLGNKQLVHYDNVIGSKSVNKVWLCEDGTFKSKLTRTGVVKESIGKYKGKNKGTWSTSSFGKTGTLTLKFDKLPDVEVELLIEDDHIFLNKKRHVALAASGCM